MSIWGNRDGESAAEEASAEVTPAAATHENDPSAGGLPESGAPADAAHEDEPSAGEPAPAFWRAQGRPLPPGYGRAPGFGQPAATAGEPEPAYRQVPAGPAAQVGEPESGYGRVPAEAPAPPVTEAPPANEAPAGTDAPAPVLAEDVVVIDAEAAVKDPALTGTARDPAEAAGEPSAAGGLRDPKVTRAPGEPAVTRDSPGSISPQRWSEILVGFVDDPRGSVKMAADAVDFAIEELVTSVRARQQALASSWQSGEADTEQLRSALREYRRFGAQVQQMSPAEPAGPRTAAAS